MDSEKVKEIKKTAISCAEKNKPYCRNCSKGNENDIMLTCRSLLKDMLALINELESENERLLNEKWDKEDDLDNYHEENQELKNRIAELEISKVDDGEKIYTCPNCHISQTVDVYNGKIMFKYCPYCGAKIVNN